MTSLSNDPSRNPTLEEMAVRVLRIRRQTEAMIEGLKEEQRALGLKTVTETIAELAKTPSPAELKHRISKSR